MRSFFPRAGWMLAGVLALYVLSALAGVVSGGPLDPPGPPGPTMRTLGDIAPSWHHILPSDDGDVDGCNSTRFTCVMGGEAVLDNETGVVWQRVPSTDNDLWNSKMAVCESINTGGRFGWRLPSVQEFGTLIDESPDFLPEGHPFEQVVLQPDTLEAFWTMTTGIDDLGSAVALKLDPIDGIQRDQLPKRDAVARAWCVRGGSAYDNVPPPVTPVP